MESKGVPLTAMYLDKRSENTGENLYNAKRIMLKYGLLLL
nr:hypothetical protein [Bacilli bacterium]